MKYAKIDIKDVVYIALSVELDLPLLTRDAKLCKGLIKKGFSNIELFDDFIRKGKSI